MSNSSTPVPSHLPSSPSEWQLYLVLQRANLLQYYETFICQGGDDVQQLLEAGEEEFLEIMALVGMAKKPLHVRRLQKALQEYTVSPTAFQLMALQKSNGGVSTPTSSVTHLIQAGVHQPLPSIPTADSPGALSTHSNGSVSIWSHNLNDNLDFNIDSYNFCGVSPNLTDSQVQRISECAAMLAKSLPEYEPKMIQNKKKIGRDLLNVMEMTMDAPNRLEEFRKYAAIYGRFDAKRKADKPLTFHEVSVNEAAAQICLHRPALLTRRDELFPLARQVVRDAGYNCLKGHSAIRTESENELSSSDTQRKRRTPVDSTGSSGIGSPASTASNNSQASPLGLQDSTQNEQQNLPPVMSDRTHEAKKRRRLDDIGSELHRIVQEQESYKLQVDQAQDLSDLHNIQRELQRLTQRQLELTDEQADLIASGVTDDITTKLEYPTAPCSDPQNGNSSLERSSADIATVNPNSDCTEDTKVGITCYSNQ